MRFGLPAPGQPQTPAPAHASAPVQPESCVRRQGRCFSEIVRAHGRVWSCVSAIVGVFMRIEAHLRARAACYKLVA